MKQEAVHKTVELQSNYNQSFFERLKRDLIKNKYIYLMAIPVIVYYAIYHYWPMYGATIAFKEFSPSLGIMGSPWVGFKYFGQFFSSVYFTRVLKNTLLMSLYSLIWSFPAPIILALLMNELKNAKFKKAVQTVTYLPHFISVVVISGMLIDFCAQDGLFNYIISILGGQPSNLLMKPELFRTIYIGSDVWQGVGWGSIIYLSALTGIDTELYEAAKVDGANRWHQLRYITIPGIVPTIIIMLILRIGSLMNIGFEKIMLLYNPATYEVADVISTFVYRKGLLEANYSYSAAVGLFNSVINFGLIIMANKLSKKYSETSLW